jgi:hypothetical protein
MRAENSKAPLVVAYGVGVDSTALLVGLVRRGIRPDLILYASMPEKHGTDAYLPVMNAYLREHGFPEVTVVSYVPKRFKHWPPYYSLEENCLTNGTLPSKAFGFGSCSMKWKAAPQHRFLKSWQPAIDCWKSGGKVRKAIGYDCSSRDKQRRATSDKCAASTYKDVNSAAYDYWYPLQDWGWDRERCELEIVAAGLPVPQKSSCFFCPAMKTHEVDALPKQQLVRIVLMEARALPRLQNVEGLWRTSTKKRPGSMTQYIKEQGLLSAEHVEAIQRVPKHLINYQEAFAAGMTKQPFTEFLAETLGEEVAQ